MKRVKRTSALGFSVLALAAAGPGSQESPQATRTSTWAEEQKLVADDASPGDWFGLSVAVEGDTAVVGTWDGDGLVVDSGSAYVFARNGTPWTQEAELLASDGNQGDHFGKVVAISGDTIVVGASANTPVQGAAYVFVRSGSSWVEQQKLLPASPSYVLSFGWSVAIEGDVVVVGARSSHHRTPLNTNCEAGSAHVFVRNGSTWIEQQALLASDAACPDHFGESVAISGSRILVGAEWGSGVAPESGSVYVFQRIEGTWIQKQELFASDGEFDDRFGYSVAVSGDMALVGAWKDDHVCPSDPTCDSGAAYAFYFDGVTWLQEQKLRASNARRDDSFGRNVAFDGGRAVVGAPLTDRADPSDPDCISGSAYLFDFDGHRWNEAQEVWAGDAECSDLFGRDVAISGDTVLAGSYLNHVSTSSPGAAYVFRTPAALSSFRNGGANPASYAVTSPPVLGGTFEGTVDLAGTSGHALALLVGYSSPLTLTLPGGQTLLVNLAAGSELLKLPPAAGPLATFQISLPPDPGLAGLAVHTQAAHFGGFAPWALSNAQDLELGY